VNKDKIVSTQSVFFQTSAKRKEIIKWIQGINKSIYNLTWNDFYRELVQLGMKEFLKRYGFSCRKKLQLVIAKSNLAAKQLTLYDFENKTEQELLGFLGINFFEKVARQANFSAKKHKLSIIHYHLYNSSLHFAAISLGFSSKQCFLNFFAQTVYVPECVENMAQNLRLSIESLHEITPREMQKEHPYSYEQPLIKNKNFLKYNYTLEELKLALETENTALVVASLGGGNVYTVNKKLQTLRPLVNVSLQVLKSQSWGFLKVNTPMFIWKIKLYQLFSEELPVEQLVPALYGPGPLYTPYIGLRWQFFTSHCAQSHADTPLSLDNPHPFFSFF
jgi:hypothetical protein